ncbi:MAG: excinuclease ABC subunit UvrC [Clostridia bacterium]|nr:excinuclease ABC subunit UvrC [Clostridia bacterium]
MTVYNENPKLGELRSKSMKLPLLPGVYIMRDKRDRIIYIGKAKALKNRVSQYFGSQEGHAEKVRRMVENVDHFEYIITDTEYEALVLECSLIKLHKPKYNILLKDDKGYHYIKITNEEYPRIIETKKAEDDGAEYLGPYTGSFAVRQSVDEACKIFKIPTCRRSFPRDIGKGRPCLNYSIGLCLAPCRGRLKKEIYDEAVSEARDFLKGGTNTSITRLTERMNECAERLEFEKAARLRDRINALRKMSDKQKVIMTSVEEQDVIALAQGSGSTCFEVFRFRGGRLVDREQFLIDETMGELSLCRSEFIKQYYSMREVPPRVTVDGEVEDAELLEQMLTEKLADKHGKKVRITVPQKGEQQHIVEMCRQNAAEYLAQAKGRTGEVTAAVDELGRLLGLDSPPEYIESYDISNTQGEDNVAGMVVFENGRPLKSAYRKFKIKTVEGQDDYGSMREVITRRIQEYYGHREEGKGFGRLPDLILLDGGEGHVNAIRPLIEASGLPIALFGMVKDSKHKTRAIAAGGREISLTRSRAAFTLVSSIQDEVHRFAITYHHASHERSVIRSSLTEIEGIGPARARELLKRFRKISAVYDASVEELCEVKGMNRTAAENIKARKKKKDAET